MRKKESKSVYVKKDKKDNKSVRPVICLNNEQKFETMRSAADFYNIDMTGISRACSRGKERYTSGKDKDGNALHWMYYKDYLEKIETEGPDYAKNRLKQWEEKKIAKEQKRLEKMHKVKKPRQVICLNTLEVYDDALKAATICKTHRSSIYESLREGGRYFTSGVDSKGNPMQWMDYKEYMTKIENGEPIRPRQDIKNRYRKSHPVKNLKTGVIYPSILKTAYHENISVYAVRESCKIHKENINNIDTNKHRWKNVSIEDYLISLQKKK